MISVKNNILFLYTIDFPYGETEPYLINELPHLSEHFSKVIIIAASKENREIILPKNVEVYFVDEIKLANTKKKLILKYSYTLLKILYGEFINTNQKIFLVKRWKLIISELIQAMLVSEKIKCILQLQNKSVVHYSFWMNKFPLALSILKSRKIINNFSFRVHGYDLYKERWPQGFIPFRNTNYKYANAVFPVSKLGLEYIKTNFTFNEKAICSYLGTANHGMNTFNNNDFVIVTCSSIIPLKRLTLISEALTHIKFSVKWFHFGEGEVFQKQNLENTFLKFPVHIKVKLMGKVTQNELFNFYKTNSVSVFVNVSETEGLPVSIMEAISFGIPVIATNVGGTSEIVNSVTGILLDKNITPINLAIEIELFKNSNLNKEESRVLIKNFWEDNFSAKHNYSLFCKNLQKTIS